MTSELATAKWAIYFVGGPMYPRHEPHFMSDWKLYDNKAAAQNWCDEADKQAAVRDGILSGRVSYEPREVFIYTAPVKFAAPNDTQIVLNTVELFKRRPEFRIAFWEAWIKLHEIDAASAVAVEPRNKEQWLAIREGHLIAAAEQYFKARPRTGRHYLSTVAPTPQEEEAS